MLGVRNYPQDYIDACRARISADVEAYRKLKSAAVGSPATDRALDAFEPSFFNNMVLVLDGLFVHRLRTVEGKDGNPLNEVRVLCTSMLENGSVMTADKTIRLSPAKSVLKYEYGAEIRLDAASFERLAAAYFTEIESRFSDRIAQRAG